MENTFDLIVVGAGPAGSSAALFAAQQGLNVCLLEKAAFPRDKTCGDAISGKSMMILKELGLLEELQQLPHAVIEAITFGNARHEMVTIPLMGDRRAGIPPGFVVRRKIFDAFLADKAGKAARLLENHEAQHLIFDGTQVVGIRGMDRQNDRPFELFAPLILGADGFNSVVARETGLFEHDPQHWVVALRQYFRNVKGLDKQIELHYLDEVIPGYLWLFPADDGTANVGIGMLHQALKAKKVNLKEAMHNALQSDFLRERFAEAQALEEPTGWNLPVGSKHRKNYGPGFLLLGDAAGLIDPFTGEGIGNALYSGKIAARVAAQARQAGDFSASFLQRYDTQLWQALGDELAVSAKLQRIGRHRTLLNFVIGKAARSAHVREIISGMMANQIPKTKLANPLFYFKLFFS